MRDYIPRRDSRFNHASDAVNHLENRFCSRNCAVPSSGSQNTFASGDCPLIFGLLLEETQVQIKDDGVDLHCMDYRPIPNKKVVEPSSPIYEGYYPDGED